MLWGRPAQSKIPMLTNPKHLILTAPHPSPLSAYRGFLDASILVRPMSFKETWSGADRLADRGYIKDDNTSSYVSNTGLGDTGRYYLDIDWKSVYIKDI